MNKTTKFHLFFIVFIILLSLFAFAGGQKETAPSGAEKEIVIGVSMDTLDHQYWQANMLGMERAAAELGIKLNVQVAENDAVKQNQQIENLIAQGVSAIVCAPKDGKAILQAVKKCNGVKIPFLFNDRAVQSTVDAKVNYGVAADNFALAKMGAEWLLDYAKKNNMNLKVLELVGDLADANVLERQKGFASVAESSNGVIEVVQRVPTEWNIEKALAGTVNAFQANPAINCVYMHSDYLLPSVQSALKQLNRHKKIGDEGHVVIAPLGGDKLSLDGMKEGYVEFCMAMPPIETGYECIQYAVKLINGEKLAGDYDLNPGFIVTPENFDKTSKETYGYGVE